jgi:hypothetical protein
MVPGRTFALKPMKRMKHVTLSRRQFAQGCSLAVVGGLLTRRASEGATTQPAAKAAAEDMPAFFRRGDEPVPEWWRRRLQLPDAKPLVDLLVKTAAERLGDPMPDPEFAKVLAMPVGEINITNSSVQRYVTATLPKCSLFYYGPLFALAFQFGGDERCKAKAIEWLDVYASWPSVQPGRGDIAESYAAMGTVLAAHWLGDAVVGEERLKSLRATWTREGATMMRWNGDSHPNNHPWFTNAGLGLLVAMHPECFKEPEKLRDQLVQTFRASLPRAFTEAGEYNDGVIYAWFTLTAAGLFAHALRDQHGIELWKEGQLERLHAFTEFGLDTTCPDGANLPGEHEVIRGFNWMMARPVLSLIARQTRDGDLLARMRGATDEILRRQRGMKLWWWFRKDLPHTGQKPDSNIYWHGPFDLTWLPPPGPTKRLDAGPRIKRYPHTGYCIARDGLLGERTVLYFRAGTASQKDMSDHNGFVWYPLGRRVIDTPRSNMDAWRDDTVNYFKDWTGFFGTSHAANVILVDGVGQKPRQSWYAQGEAEWFNLGKAATTSRIVDERRFEDGVRWVGEAQDAYPGRLKLWRRSVELRNWLKLSIRDEIQAAKPDAKIEWLLHTPGEWRGEGQRFNVTCDGVRVDAEFVLPAGASVKIEQTPIGQDGKRTSYLRATSAAKDGVARFDVRLTAHAK